MDKYSRTLGHLRIEVESNKSIVQVLNLECLLVYANFARPLVSCLDGFWSLLSHSLNVWLPKIQSKCDFSCSDRSFLPYPLPNGGSSVPVGNNSPNTKYYLSIFIILNLLFQKLPNTLSVSKWDIHLLKDPSSSQNLDILWQCSCMLSQFFVVILSLFSRGENFAVWSRNEFDI